MWPSPVLASIFVWKSDGSTRSTLPSPVRIVQLAGFYGAVSCAEAYFTFEVLNSNAAVVGVEIDRAVQRVGLHRPIAGMHIYRPIDGFGQYGSVAGFDLKVGFARHADLNVKVPRIAAKGEAPVAGDTRAQLDLVSILTGVDAEVLSQLVAMVFDAKFHLFRIARGNPHAAVIGLHAHVGAPSHGKRLGDFFGAGRDRRSSQKGRAGNSQPNRGQAVGKRVHGKDPP